MDGISLDALRSKYLSVAFQRDMSEAVDPIGYHSSLAMQENETTGSRDETTSEHAVAAGEAVGDGRIINHVRICRTCNGIGIVKSLYNHMVMERTCTDCEGEGVIVASSEPPAEPAESCVPESSSVTFAGFQSQ
jgi:DnaJ-class molecular chaperone